MKIRRPMTIVMAYYENAEMLNRHLLEWVQYPARFKKNLRAIIVDDGSPKNPASQLMQQMIEVGFLVNLFRIKEDIPWNQNGARNLAMTHANGWCLLTDMDHLLSVDQLPALFSMRLKKAKHYMPLRRKAITLEQYKRHPNTYVLHRDAYWDIGGFDESYAGYYGTDSTFRKRLKQNSKLVKTDVFVMTLFGREVIADASTTVYGRKGTKYHVSKNQELNERKKRTPDPIQPLNFEWEQLL